MKRAPWLYTLMQIALWSIHGVLISYAQRYLAGMGMRDSAIGLLLGGATAAGFVLQPLLAAVCDRSRLTVRLTLLTGGGLMLLCCAALLPAAKSLTLTAAFYAVACCMAQTVPSFVNALGMAVERKGMRLNFGISRGAGSIGFGLTAQLANVLLLRGGLRTVPLYSLWPCRHSDGHGVLLPPHGGGRAGGGDGAGLRPWPVPARQPALLPAAGGRVPAVLRP